MKMKNWFLSLKNERTETLNFIKICENRKNVVSIMINCDSLHVIAKFEKWIVFDDTRFNAFANDKNLKKICLMKISW